MIDLVICKRNRDAYVKQARVDACDPAVVGMPALPGYWELFFNDDAPVRERKLRTKFAGILEPNSYFTGDEARLALCLYADMLESYDWP